MLSWAQDIWQSACGARWPAGSVFGKELRVAGRRRRSYSLRFLYVFSLSVFIVVVWLAGGRCVASGGTWYDILHEGQ